MKKSNSTPKNHKPAVSTASKVGAAVLFCGGVMMLATNADAFTAPAAGSFAYDIYDIGVNDILKGPIGFVGGVGAMVAAGVMAIRQMILPATATVLGGAFLLKADSVVSTMGMMVI